MGKYTKNRRTFLKQSVAATAGIGLAGCSTTKEKVALAVPPKKTASNDQIQLALIGCGIQGFINAATAVKVEGVKIVAACDLYSGRCTRAKELYGQDVFTTPDYKEILARADVDAVCIATSDHWHDHITIAALDAGKAVYCEKPMVHHLDEGHAVIAAEKRSSSPLIVGSQGVSSIVTEKAAELYKSGAIGNLVFVDIYNDRNSSGGAWNYSIPTDSGPETVDWDRYLGDAPKRPYDHNRFFRWRNYQDYGTGAAGDMFVHFFSSLHAITGSMGPNRIYATGGLRYWKDGRDVPDIIVGSFDYPESDKHSAFNLQLRVNFVDGAGGGGGLTLVGDEGTMSIRGNSLTLEHNPIQDYPQYGGYDSFSTFSLEQQSAFEKDFKVKHPDVTVPIAKEGIEFSAPPGYSAHVSHWSNFADAIRTGSSIVEDGSFGLRACGPALASNVSYFEKRIVDWDPVKMKEV